MVANVLRNMKNEKKNDFFVDYGHDEVAMSPQAEVCFFVSVIFSFL